MRTDARSRTMAISESLTSDVREPQRAATDRLRGAHHADPRQPLRLGAAALVARSQPRPAPKGARKRVH
jgi:hypothetical protein